MNAKPSRWLAGGDGIGVAEAQQVVIKIIFEKVYGNEDGVSGFWFLALALAGCMPPGLFAASPLKRFQIRIR